MGFSSISVEYVLLQYKRPIVCHQKNPSEYLYSDFCHFGGLILVLCTILLCGLSVEEMLYVAVTDMKQDVL